MNDAALFGMVYVSLCALGGTAFAAALYFWRHRPMALYEVTRTDSVGPGEFVSATVIARGTAQAREAVAHMAGVVAKGTKRNVKAEPVNMSAASAQVHVIAAYFDESPMLFEADAIDPATDYDSLAVEPETF